MMYSDYDITSFFCWINNYCIDRYQLFYGRCRSEGFICALPLPHQISRSHRVSICSSQYQPSQIKHGFIWYFTLTNHKIQYRR